MLDTEDTEMDEQCAALKEFMISEEGRWVNRL